MRAGVHSTRTPGGFVQHDHFLALGVLHCCLFCRAQIRFGGGGRGGRAPFTKSAPLPPPPPGPTHPPPTRPLLPLKIRPKIFFSALGASKKTQHHRMGEGGRGWTPPPLNPGAAVRVISSGKPPRSQDVQTQSCGLVARP